MQVRTTRDTYISTGSNRAHFYKDVEEEWDSVKYGALYGSEDAESKQAGLRLLSVVIAAREAHTEWFYSGEPDPNHKDHEHELRSSRETVIKGVYDMEYAIVTNMSKPLIQEIIRSHIKQVSASDFPNQPVPKDDSFLEKYSAYREELCMKRKEYMDQLLPELDTVELMDMNNTSPAKFRMTKFDYAPELFITDYSEVDWDAVPASFYPSSGD
ncbi:hypothetical protein PG991_002986 [Apiospora marii]|uniref:Uncharacterized protein n=1 Tax=Apiospora marii TaxID=335849 RepID=A0ABR1SJ95_9PEZI